eukprot:tig00020961_g16623.t1
MLSAAWALRVSVRAPPWRSSLGGAPLRAFATPSDPHAAPVSSPSSASHSDKLKIPKLSARDWMAAAGRRFRSDAEEDDDRSLTKEEEDEERAQPQKRRLLPKREEMMRLWNLARPEAPILLTAIACLGVASATSLAFPKIMGSMMDVASRGAAGVEELQSSATLLAALFGVGAVASSARSVLLYLTTERIALRLRQQMFASVIEQDLAFFDEARTGEIINRLGSDVKIVAKCISENASSAARSVLALAVSLVLLLSISPKLTVISVSVLLPMAALAAVYGRYIKLLSKSLQGALAEATSVAEERLGSVRLVRYFAREPLEKERYWQKALEVFRTGREGAIANGLYTGFATSVANLSSLLVLFVGGTMVAQGAITVGDLTAFSMYAVYAGLGITGASSVYSELMRAVGASARVFEILERVPAVPCSGGRRLERLEGHVELRGVVFRYPTRPEAEVLSGLDLAIHPGRMVAVVGGSGSGKSTIAALIARLYEPDAGAVLFDGVDARTLDPRWLRESIGIVPQELTLFATSIRENIRYGRLDATDEEVEQAAREANAEEFIRELPDGYETHVGEAGRSLSGGQKQRVAIARALVKRPRLLILDEATSALDNESERLVQEALQRATRGRSCLVIAHRLSTIEHADTIAVLQDGRIAELGSYSELMARDGPFRRLVSHASV